MTEVDKAVDVPPVPEHITLTVNCSLYEPAKPQLPVNSFTKSATYLCTKNWTMVGKHSTDQKRSNHKYNAPENFTD